LELPGSPDPLKGGNDMPSRGEGDKPSFERDIKPLCRTKDRDSMLAAFDLFDYADVVEHADAIVSAAQREDAVQRRVARRSARQASAVD
jgi:hypothetical protein